ncbi:histidine kinase [Lewinella sp. W8]|uniref:sensor histidine kinase n=1 Tax=Lewinella sp. W8 TaxID=2528208 RepID=UPI0034CD710A
MYCWAGAALGAQTAQLSFKNLGTEAGLPSSEVYVSYEDHQGYIWFGTDNGLARYNGYDFDIFDSRHGLQDVVVFSIVSGPENTLWVSTYTGRVFYLEGDQFVPYENNDILLDIKRNTPFLVILGVEPSGSLILNVRHEGILRLTRNGTQEWLTDRQQDAMYLVEEIEGRNNGQGLTSINKGNLVFPMPWVRQDSLVIHTGNYNEWSEKHYLKLRKEPRLPYVSYGAKFNTEGPWDLAFVTTRFFYGKLKGEDIFSVPLETNAVNYMMPDNQGGIWLCSSLGSGLLHLAFDPETKQITTMDSLLTEYSISYCMYDRQGGLWISTLDKGVFYNAFPTTVACPMRQKLPNSRALSVALVEDEGVYAGFANGELHYVDFNSMESRKIYPNDPAQEENLFKFYEVFYDKAYGRVHTSKFSFLHPFPQNGSESDLQRYFSPEGGRVKPIKRLSIPWDSTAGELGFSASIEIGTLDRASGRVKDFFSTFDGKDVQGPQYLYVDKGGKNLIGTLHGLYELEESLEIGRPDIDFSGKDERVEVIHQLKNGAYLFGTRGNGIVYFDPAGKERVINIDDGLASNMVRDFIVDEEEVIYVATLNGLSVFRLTPDGEPLDVRSFGQEHGIVSDEIHGLEVAQDVVWLATSEGVMRFSIPPKDTTSYPPIITEITVDGTPTLMDSRIKLRPGTKNIQIDYCAIDFHQEGNIAYRYRIDSEDEWTQTDGVSVIYPQLRPGTYHFEIASKSRDGVWSTPTSFSLIIPQLWYRTLFAQILFALMLISGLVVAVLRYGHNRRKEQTLLIQINNLERSALQAQMNPHFVFNCLNSIQSFILQDQSMEAVSYLGLFANLVRQTLNASAKGTHSLREEIEMLDNYLRLEKLRFKEVFNYGIHQAPDLPLDDYQIPTLLIQPFIENAVIHGMKERESGGRIDVYFSMEGSELEVSIVDNGPGFQKQHGFPRKSMGIEITRRRLEMMPPTPDGRKRMELETLRDFEGKVAGTQIMLMIFTRNLSE